MNHLAVRIAVSVLVVSSVAHAGTMFTYQAQIKQGGSPVNGTVDITVRVFGSASGGLVPLGSNNFPSTAVTDGLVALDLDFGGAVFNGSDRWLEIEVDGNVLLPRQQVLPTPYAMHAQSIGDGALPATYTGQVDFTNALNQFVGNGSGITKLDASNVTAGNLGATHLPTGGSWTLSTNLSVDSGTFYVDPIGNKVGIGTTSPGSPLEVIGSSETEAIYAYHTAATGFTTAVYGRTNSSDGKGVFGSANAASGATYGVFGQVLSPDGVGVYGVHNTTTGSAAGVLGETNSTAIGAAGVHGRLTNAAPGALAAGVRGENPSTGGVGIGVWGSHAGSGWGVYGSTDNGYGVIGAATGSAGRGVFGEATSASGLTNGGRFEAASTSGRGVFAHATASTGFTYGVYGQTDSPNGFGVYGVATASIGTNYGVYGRNDSPNGRGVYGEATDSSAVNYGGYFVSNSPTGFGAYCEAPWIALFARATATTGTIVYGVHAESASVEGSGVYGEASAISGVNNGVRGQSASTSGRGVLGVATASTGATYGAWGESASTAGRGVYGLATASTGGAIGVLGRSDSTDGRGLYGFASANSGDAIGVYGRSLSAVGYDFYAGGPGIDYGTSSSRRWKNNIVPIDNPLTKLARLRGVYYDWDEEHGGHHDVGMIAEEVGAVLPEIVQYETNGIDASGMDYSKMTPLLVEAVNALRAEKDAQIAELEARIATLEAALRDR